MDFSGEAIAIYGGVSPTNTDLQVELDGVVHVVPMGARREVSGNHAQVTSQHAFFPSTGLLTLSRCC